jgi:hypothetical protein
MLSSRSRRELGNTIQSYAEIPVFLAANEKRKNVIENEGYFLDHKNMKIRPSPYAMDEKNQQAVFEKFLGYLER